MPNKKTVAVHQPNFFPWLGYFNKIARADVFILLDNVQFPKTGGIWTNRVKIMVNKKANWITVPIIRSYHGFKLVNEIEINDSTSWRQRMLATIETNYKKAHFYDIIFPILVSLLSNTTKNLCDLNINILKSLMDYLNLPWKKCVKASSIPTTSKSTELLIELTKYVGGSVYLCGGGAEGYQDDNLFIHNNIDLVYQNYSESEYNQNSATDHLYGLSIIDALMNCGIDETRRLINH